MNTLKRSRPVKIFCFLLGCIFTALFALNAAVGALALLTDRADIFTADAFSSPDGYRQDVLLALAGEKSVKLRMADVVRAAAEGEGETFFAEHRQFREGNTNYAFEVKDETGRVLLGNFTPASALAEHTETITASAYRNGAETFIIYDPLRDDYEVSYNGNVTEEPAGPTDADLSAEPAETAPAPEESAAPETNAAEPTAANAELTTEMPAEPTAAAPAGRVNTNPVATDEEEVYIRDDTADGYKSVMMYIYPTDDDINETILNHCIELYHKKFEPGEAQYYLSGAYEIYHQTDFAVSANGTAYFIGTMREPTRETPAELIGQKTYTLTVRVDAALGAKDSARYAVKGLGAVTRYLTHFMPLTLFFGLAALLFTVLSLCFAGWVKTEDAPVARGVHKIPADFVFLGFAGAMAALAALVYANAEFLDRYYPGVSEAPELWIVTILSLPLIAVLLFACVYLFAVKLKTRTAVSSLLLVRFFKWCGRLAKRASAAMNVLWKLALVYVAGGIIGLILLLAFHDSSEMLLICFLIFKAAELLAYVLIAINLHTLQQGAKALSEGRREKIDLRSLFGEFRKHAEYLNNIGSGINAAVEERLKSEKTKTELITNVSHDLKTPLTSIISYVDLLKKEPIDNEKALEYIAVIDRQSQRLKKLATDIVDASKAAAGSVEVRLEPTDLGVLLGQLMGEYAEKLAGAGLTLVHTFPQESVSVTADGRLLWRALDNLMNNAVKYSMPGTRVYLTLEHADGRARVLLRNISAESLNVPPETLTDRFVRGDSSRNTEGSGLGLYIAKSLTELMGGRFAVEVDGDLFKVTVEMDENA
jgi:signal transduction histidine kinase